MVSPATGHLGPVCHSCPAAAGPSRADRCFGDATVRPHHGDEFLSPRGWRGAAPVAAHVLVLRPPTSLHSGLAGHGSDLRYPLDLLPQPDLRLSGDGVLHDLDCFPVMARLWPSYVHQRHE